MIRCGSLDYVRGLGANEVVDYSKTKFEDVVPAVDAVLDMVGGETQRRSFSVLKPGGILVSVVSPVPKEPPLPRGMRSVFFLVDVSTARLETLSKLFDSGELQGNVGTILPLASAVTAHEMLGGAPHARGKIVLQM
jgi:NADPH:quinone reductase-like Zn-dependent oxidoreductase